MEEAAAYKSLLKDYGMTQEELSKQIGKSRSAVANTLRLLALPAEVMTMLEEGTLSAGHARAILGAPSPALQVECAKKVVENQLSVRQTEALVKTISKERPEKPEPVVEKDNIQIYLDALEKDLSGLLGRKVKIAHKGKKGKIELEYYGNEDLEVLLAALKSMRGGSLDG